MFLTGHWLEKLALAIACALALSVVIVVIVARMPPPIDRGECLESHTRTYTVIVPIGKISVPQVRHSRVCDRWEFPKGRLTRLPVSP